MPLSRSLRQVKAETLGVGLRMCSTPMFDPCGGLVDGFVEILPGREPARCACGLEHGAAGRGVSREIASNRYQDAISLISVNGRQLTVQSDTGFEHLIPAIGFERSSVPLFAPARWVAANCDWLPSPYNLNCA